MWMEEVPVVAECTDDMDRGRLGVHHLPFGVKIRVVQRSQLRNSMHIAKNLSRFDQTKKRQKEEEAVAGCCS